MEMDLETKQQLAYLLAKPATVTQAHAGLLASLIKTYPYYQPLHLLLARANNNSTHNDHLATAAVYNNGGLLHQVVYQPESLMVSQLKIVPAAHTEIEKNLTNEQVDLAEDLEFIEAVPYEDHLSDDQETFEEIVELNPIPTKENKTDEQEVFDEIAEIDPTAYIPALEEGAKTTTTEEKLSPEDENLPDELAIESIVATDFFAFEKSFHTELPTEEQKTASISVTQPEEYNQEAEAQTVSKYNDDKLPYTFLWWLAKTRKEHEQIFQPYVTPKKNTNPSELQQQYVEHIFHLQTPFNIADEASKGPLNRQVVSKGGDIIDSFIKNEPQIRPPKPEQINNENKAKKSAEDHYDLVSETLAAIYIEQMLYHKAIDTYEKLSLKFPEKSRYFADLIQSLEKKI